MRLPEPEPMPDDREKNRRENLHLIGSQIVRYAFEHGPDIKNIRITESLAQAKERVQTFFANSYPIKANYKDRLDKLSDTIRDNEKLARAMDYMREQELWQDLAKRIGIENSRTATAARAVVRKSSFMIGLIRDSVAVNRTTLSGAVYTLEVDDGSGSKRIATKTIIDENGITDSELVELHRAALISRREGTE